MGRKGFADRSCRVCKVEEESFEHIWVCEEIRGKIKVNIVKELDEWKRQNSSQGRDRWETIKGVLQGKPLKEICNYAREIEKIARDGN